MIYRSSFRAVALQPLLTLLKKTVFAVTGSLLLVISAKLIIPIWPVNGTLQTFVLPLLGVFLNPRLGSASVALYLLEGALGLPVFTSTPEKGIGLAYMMGPTAGFLVGFIPSTYVTGLLYERGWCTSMVSTLKVVILSSLFVIIPGLLWLAYLFGIPTAVTTFLGIFPGSIVKTSLATLLIYKVVNR